MLTTEPVATVASRSKERSPAELAWAVFLSPPLALRPLARAHPRELQVPVFNSQPAGRMGRLDQSTGCPVITCAIRHTQASSIRAAKFFAAFRSRSTASPQASQWNTRAERGRSPFFTRHREQSFDDGYHLDATHNVEPYHTDL